VSDFPSGSDVVPEPGGRVRLVVIYGGQSAEHEVSCISAFHVLRAADPARYDRHVVGITTDGRWVDADAAVAAMPEGQASLPSPDTMIPDTMIPAKAIPAAVIPRMVTGQAGPGAVTGPARPSAFGAARPQAALGGGGEAGAVDPLAAVRSTGDETVVVFPLLHGPNGEDGTVQGLLEVAGVPYVGAGVAASATAMDKGLTKAVLAAAGLPQVKALVRREHELDDLTAKTVEAELGWPVFVKPANLGSSIGISRAGDAVELAAAIQLARRYDEWVVIEEAVVAREIEVGVLGTGAGMRASVPGEIIPSREFYDFEDKYEAGAAMSQIPADLPPDVAGAARRAALEVCRALRIDGMARVDFFYEHPGRGLLVNEVNTIPGFTPISQYPQLWAATGVDYQTLVDELVRLALVRHERRSKFERRRQLP
jgi:D-alanine-D-alanine ligase